MNTFECIFAGRGKVFNVKHNHDIHVKIVHHDGRVTLPTIVPQAGPSNIIPQADLSNAGPSNKDVWGSDFEDDDELLAALDMDFEMDKDKISFIMPHHVARELVLNCIDLLEKLVQENPIKVNLKLKASYYKPHVDNSAENRAFKTSARQIFFDSEIEDIVEEKCMKLMSEQEIYQGRGSGFSLQHTDGLLLGVYKFQSIGGSSYIPLPKDIVNKRAVVNPHNMDEECFKPRMKLSGQVALDQHKLICGEHKPILPVMPETGSKLKFDACGKMQRHPIYADLEAILEKMDEKKGQNTTIIQNHKPMSYGIFVKAADDVLTELLDEFEIPTESLIYRGTKDEPNAAKHFVKTIVGISQRVEKLLKTNKPIIMTAEDVQSHVTCQQCNLCKGGFSAANPKVANHNHLSGKFRQTLCNTCNLKLQVSKFVPCFFHNLSNYDSHFIVTELSYNAKTISVIPNSEEKFISFSKYVSNTFTVRFIDTFRFIASSLLSLASYLHTSDLEKFRKSKKVFNIEDTSLVTRKGVYPYEYTDSWKKLEDEILPEKEQFYNAEYIHAKDAWNHFNCRTFGEYSDLYLKIDVMLLADVFENFRDICMTTYNLDPAYYYTAPGFSFGCMLKYTMVELELLSHYDMLLMFEKGIRGGLVQASMRYAKANNYTVPDYNRIKGHSWIIYQDCNNLYGWAMSQYKPHSGFQWKEPTLDGLEELTDTSDIGRVYELDIAYPEHLHVDHNDLPFFPNNGVLPGSKVNTLIFFLFILFIIFFVLFMLRVHRILQFEQSRWLAKYINLNIEMRMKAANDFEKDFYKLMNNAVFDKTMESMRRRIDIELVSYEKRTQKLINKTTFKHCTSYNENLCAVSLGNKIIYYIGKSSLGAI
ncbi:Ribonuclease H-like domain [Cinara cedri]|uniref:Ribonuclease H-like domain n=1 Tax=Cinara cedri TaxID=506608 RepID=A0A5E4NQP4_9HEMI|nr:Ribonuclease H-like domain [Cinara cedri]